MSGRRQRVRLIKNPAFDLEMVANVRRVARAAETFRLAPPAGADYARVLLAAALWNGEAPMPEELLRSAAFLEEIGVLIPPGDAPGVVDPDLPLDGSLLAWVPERARREVVVAMASQPLTLNPEVFFQERTSRPEGIEDALPPAPEFPRGPGLLWVRSPQDRTWAAYRPSAEVREIVRRLQRRRLRYPSLPSDVRELLVHAHILVPRDVVADGARAWSLELARRGRSLRRDGYAHLRRLVTPLQVAQMRMYFRAREREGYFEYDKKQVREKRLRSYNDVVASHMQRQSSRVIRDVTGEAVVPSFNYVSRYLPGAKLRRHVDRDQCRWNVSCLIESNHGEDLQRSSPLHLEIRGEEHEIRLDFGDAVLYQGRRLPHWRDAMREGDEQTTLLFFYVPVEFMGALC